MLTPHSDLRLSETNPVSDSLASGLVRLPPLRLRFLAIMAETAAPTGAAAPKGAAAAPAAGATAATPAVKPQKPNVDLYNEQLAKAEKEYSEAMAKYVSHCAVSHLPGALPSLGCRAQLPTYCRNAFDRLLANLDAYILTLVDHVECHQGQN